MSKYGSDSIKVLEGLEAVRLRPGMYIGTTGQKGMHHLLWEIVDNCVDEVANGYASNIVIDIMVDGSIAVSDDGRGVPVDIHPEYKVSGAELIFTKLHAGGKFDNNSYNFSGGLHGVGAAVVNALSKWLKVEIFKSGTKYEMSFCSVEKNGKIMSGIVDKPMSTSSCDKELKGTRVSFLPDSLVFGNEKFNFDTINKRIKELAFLNAGLQITINDHRVVDGKVVKSKTYQYEGGISDYVSYLNEGSTIKYSPPVYLEKMQDKFFVSLAFQHTDNYSENIYSYVNNIPTSEGGTHETGFKSAFTKVFNDFGRQKNIIKDKQPNFLGEDFREGLTAVLCVKMQEVQFEGQTKTKLGNPEAKTIVENLLSDALKDFLNRAKKEVVDAIFDKATMASKARESATKAKEVARKINSMSNSALIGKLASCSGRKAELNELFIVEGDSAGGSAKQGRDRRFQAILPLKGKPLNSEKKRIADIVKNDEIMTIINALGAGFGADFDIGSLKYHKVVILADADQDGAHIRALLLTFFYRYMKDLIKNGNVYIGMPPLYKVSTKSKEFYAYDDNELEELIKSVGKGYTLQRYKGLGEMNPEQLWDTTMNPNTRTLMKVTVENAAEVDKLITQLMGDEVEPRKAYIYEYANFNKIDNFKQLNNNNK